MNHKTLDSLLKYAAGQLAPDDAADVRRDIEHDPEAAEIVAWYRLMESVLGQDDSAEPPEAALARCIDIFDPRQLPEREAWLDRVDALIATLVVDGRQAVAGLRVAGGGERFNLLYTAGETEIDLQARHVETAADDSAEQWHLIGRISSDVAGPYLAVATSIQSSETPLARTATDDRGCFRLELPAGRYDLLFRIDRRTVVVPGIELL